MGNTDIFICTHKDFTPIVKSDSYKIVSTNKLCGSYNLGVIQSENTTGTPLDDKFWSEILHMKYVSDRIELKEFVGFCHYRRYFSYLDNIPEIKENECIALKRFKFPFSIKEQYEACHNIEDLKIAIDVVKNKYPEYYSELEKYLNGNLMYPCNMFVMHNSKFREYIDFLFNIFDGYFKITGTDIRKRINGNSEKYLRSNNFDYQYRIGGFLAERLTGVFLIHNFKKINEFNYIFVN
jgi:hypothetical protein